MRIYLIVLFIIYSANSYSSSQKFCSFLRAIAYASETPMTQKQLIEMYDVLKSDIKINKFVKDIPVLVFELKPGDKYETIPEDIRDNLGKVDYRGEAYDDAYVQKNIGGAVALQYSDGKPDFYIIGSDTYQSKYKPDSVANVTTKNKKMWDGLVEVFSQKRLTDLVEGQTDRMKGVRKEAPVEMIYLSDLGFSISDQAGITPSWGGQLKLSIKAEKHF